MTQQLNFSTNLVFDTANYSTGQVILTDNVSSLILPNGTTTNQTYSLKLYQDSVGNRTVSRPSNYLGQMLPYLSPNSYVTYYLIWNGTNWVEKIRAVEDILQVPSVPVIQGPPGPPGVSGLTILSLTANSTISAYSVIALIDGIPVLADNMNLSHASNVVGIATGGCNAGGLLNIQYNNFLTYNGWSWITGNPIFLSNLGRLTQTAPTTGFSQVIGTPVNSNTILINLGPAIFIN